MPDHPIYSRDLPSDTSAMRQIVQLSAQPTEDPKLNSNDRYGIWPQRHRPDILAFGCSVTAGVGIERQFTWPAIARKLTGASVNLCSRGGSSLAFQIRLISEQIAIYGAPKAIIGLIPNLERSWLPAAKPSEATTIRDQHYTYDPDLGYLPSETSAVVFTHLRDKMRFREKALPPFVATWNNLNLLWILDHLCDAFEIPLTLSSWNQPTVELGPDLPSFSCPAYRAWRDPRYHIHPGWGDPSDRRCGHTPANSEQAQVWEIGSDRWHPGLHHQIHFCEHLLQTEISQEQVATL